MSDGLERAREAAASRLQEIWTQIEAGSSASEFANQILDAFLSELRKEFAVVPREISEPLEEAMFHKLIQYVDAETSSHHIVREVYAAMISAAEGIESGGGGV